MDFSLPSTTETLLVKIREFMEREVYPFEQEWAGSGFFALTPRLEETRQRVRDAGLWAPQVPTEYGGLGLDYTTFASIFEELSKGFMSISGAIGTHHILTYVLTHSGTEEQKRQFLPDLASGKKRGGLALTEPSGGTDVANLQTTADKDGEEYVINGTKMFITNGRYGDSFLLLARTDRTAEPNHSGISAFVIEKGDKGFKVGRDLDKLGYRGLDTCELIFEDFRVPAENLVGEVEGRGFGQVMSGLETGRINVAARAVGVAQAAFNASIRYSQQRQNEEPP